MSSSSAPGSEPEKESCGAAEGLWRPKAVCPITAEALLLLSWTLSYTLSTLDSAPIAT